jgi:hypothetical protein
MWEGEKTDSRGDRSGSPNYGGENRIVWKCLALLGIVREEGTDAREVLASTTGD